MTSDNRRAVRVFVSSTFKDMQEERNHLVASVFPVLRDWCLKHGIFFNEVDLRWGIPVGATPALEVCLEEVDNCRPFFIGLIGNFWGSLAERDKIGESTDIRYPWINSEGFVGRSYTELEIQHGVLRNLSESDVARSMFYFRDSSFSKRITEVLVDEEIEKRRKNNEELKPGDSRTRADEKKGTPHLERLRAEILKSGALYRDNYLDPVSLGEWVLADLKEHIATEFGFEPNIADSRPTGMEFDATPQKLLIGDMRLLRSLNRHVADGGPPLVIISAPGTGKSTLLRSWTGMLKDYGPGDVSIPLFFGKDGAASFREECLLVGANIDEAICISAESLLEQADWAGLLRRAAQRLSRSALPESALGGSSRDQAMEFFVRAVQSLPEDRATVLCLDGIDHLEDFDSKVPFGPLPDVFPRQLRVVISADIKSLPPTSNWKFLRTPAWSTSQRESFLRHYAYGFGKKFEPNDKKRIAREMAKRSPLALRLIVDHLRLAVGKFDKLEASLRGWLTTQNDSELLHSFLGTLDKRLIDGGADRGLPARFITLLKASRSGLSEDEARRILGDTAGPLPSAHWSPLFLALDGYLKGCGDRWRAGDALAAAVDCPLDSSREKIITYFASSPADWRRIQEQPWQLRKTGNRKGLADLLSQIDLLVIMWEERRSELQVYVRWLAGDFDPLECFASVIRDPIQHERALPAVSGLLIDSGYLPKAEITLCAMRTLANQTHDHFRATDAALALSRIFSIQGRRDEACSTLVAAIASLPAEGRDRERFHLCRNLSKILRQQAEIERLSGRETTALLRESKSHLEMMLDAASRNPDLGIRAACETDACEAAWRENESNPLAEHDRKYAGKALCQKASCLEKTARLLGSTEYITASLHYKGLGLQLQEKFRASGGAIDTHSAELALATDDFTEIRARSALARAGQGGYQFDLVKDQIIACEGISNKLRDPLLHFEIHVMTAKTWEAMGNEALAARWRKRALDCLSKS